MEVTFAAQKRKKTSNQGLVETEILHKRERERLRVSFDQYIPIFRLYTENYELH